MEDFAWLEAYWNLSPMSLTLYLLFSTPKALYSNSNIGVIFVIVIDKFYEFTYHHINVMK